MEREFHASGQKREALNIQLQLLAEETKERDESKAMVDAAEARVKQKSVVESEARLRLNRMTIRAPVDGRVYELVASPGARVGSGVMTAMADHDGSSVITMYRPESLQIRVDVRFEDIPKVSLGQIVQISNPALEEPIRGRVLFVSSEADIQKNTLQVKVAIEDPPGFFKPEMLVDVTFLAPKQVATSEEASNKELTLLVPQHLVVMDDGAPFVWLADQSGGVALKTSVVTGRKGNDGMWEIVDGLDIGSRIISGNLAGLEHGDRLQVTGEANVEKVITMADAIGWAAVSTFSSMSHVADIGRIAVSMLKQDQCVQVRNRIMALVEIKDVNKHYHKGGQTIKPLDGVSLDIDAGEFISLMGASGTGKSTLFKCDCKHRPTR